MKLDFRIITLCVVTSVACTLLTLHFRSHTEEDHRQLEAAMAKSRAGNPVLKLIDDTNANVTGMNVKTETEFAAQFAMKFLSAAYEAETATAYPITKADLTVTTKTPGILHVSVRRRAYGSEPKQFVIAPVELDLRVVQNEAGFIVTMMKQTPS